MPRRKKHDVIHNRISAKIEHWDAAVEIAVNRDAANRWQRTSPDDRVYQPESRLELRGVITTAGKRRGHPIEITVYGAKEDHDVSQLKLRDIHVRDKDGVPLYKAHRGVSLPVYDLEHASLGFIDKVRGENAWTAFLWADQDLLARMTDLLRSGRDVYAAVHEVRAARTRRIVSFSLQTTDPEDE